ncbi:MAG: LexA family transcriptional regulator [Alphaproteobacteria bacterium]|nr:LexA family transcriptional regulator [Alphaproteobacteria bacterium]
MQQPGPQIYIREWREAREMTQQQLADAVGRDKSVISKLERGLSGLTTPTLNGIARTLGVNPSALYQPPPNGTRPLRDDEAGQGGSVSIKRPRANTDGADLPIYASAPAGATAMALSYDPIDWVKRPEPLLNADNGFGLYVVGDCMEPAYRQGDLILIHPNRPANPGDDVLVVKQPEAGSHEAMIRTLISGGDEIRLKQHNPSTELSVARADAHAVYLIVGKYHSR